MMASGWIKLHRSIADNDLWTSEKFTRGQAWVDLLMLTMHDIGHIRVNGIRIDLVRGECGYSELKLSKRWIWSRPKVKKFLKELEKDSMISRKSYNGFNIISVCNYSLYQSNVTTDDTTDDTTEVQRKSTGSTTDGTLLKNVNNDKNVKNDKKEDTGVSPKKSKNGSRISDDWTLTQNDIQFANKKGYTHDQLATIAEGFKDYWLAKSGKDATKRDWEATFRSWVNNDIKFHGDPTRRNSGSRTGGKTVSGQYGPVSKSAVYGEIIDQMGGLQGGCNGGYDES